MSFSIRFCSWTPRAVLVLGLALVIPALAFPPAPHHSVFGMARDEQGNPISATGATVVLEVGGSMIAQTAITATGDLGTNYRLTIPLDAGVTADKYKPTALLPTVPFRMRVKVGNVTYLPIEMVGAAALLTKPGESTRLDLTLGEDSDGDGIPDAWERTLNAAMGGNRSLADIRPEDDADGDGLTNLQEYLAGTYAFDPADGFALTIRSVEAGRPVLEFTAIRGRSYTIDASTDMQNWSPVSFTILAEGANAATRGSYTATDVRLLRITAAPPTEGDAAPRFFRLMVH